VISRDFGPQFHIWWVGPTELEIHSLDLEYKIIDPMVKLVPDINDLNRRGRP